MYRFQKRTAWLTRSGYNIIVFQNANGRVIGSRSLDPVENRLIDKKTLDIKFVIAVAIDILAINLLPGAWFVSIKGRQPAPGVMHHTGDTGIFVKFLEKLFTKAQTGRARSTAQRPL